MSKSGIHSLLTLVALGHSVDLCRLWGLDALGLGRPRIRPQEYPNVDSG